MRRVKYDSGIYTYETIRQAIKDYKELAFIVPTRLQNSTVCNFMMTKYDEELTIKEFGNYLIDLMNSK